MVKGKLKMKKLLAMLLLCAFIFANAQDKRPSDGKAKVTFIELGSVNCIPCKQMQPVMKAIEKKYNEQVKVIFYDVWTQEQKKYASQYKIKLIPTQIFLDEKGKEFFRHEGFYPEKEIDKLIESRGVKPSINKN